MKHRSAPQVTALDLGSDAKPTPEIAAYFAKCREKLGFVPNVLRAYAFDNVKLQAFIDMADDLMLGDSGLTVSTVGLGCNNFGRRIDEETTSSVVRAAIDASASPTRRAP